MDRKKTKPLPKISRSNTPAEQDEVIQRLLDEVRMLRGILVEIRHEVNCSEADFERMSVVGGIKKLAKDRRESQEEVRKLHKDLERLIKLTK